MTRVDSPSPPTSPLQPPLHLHLHHHLLTFPPHYSTHPLPPPPLCLQPTTINALLTQNSLQTSSTPLFSILSPNLHQNISNLSPTSSQAFKLHLMHRKRLQVTSRYFGAKISFEQVCSIQIRVKAESWWDMLLMTSGSCEGYKRSKNQKSRVVNFVLSFLSNRISII